MNPLLVYIARISVIGALIVPIAYIATLLNKPEIWRTDENDPDDVKTFRVQMRGTLSSLLTGILLTLVSVIMIVFKVQENDIEILFGFLFSPMIGYLMDIGVGTDKGLGTFKENRYKGFKYIMESLVDAKFPRFIITFLLDMFITKPISAVFKGFAIFNLMKATPSAMFGWIDKFTLKNITGIVQSFVAIITFQTFTNQTRFLWAYPDAKIDKSDLIPSSTIILSVSIAASLYLVTYSTEASSLSLNLCLVLFTCILISAMVYTNTIDASEDKEDDAVDNKRYYIGLGIFGFFIMFGMLMPFLNRLKVPGELTILDKMTDPVVLRVIDALNKK